MSIAPVSRICLAGMALLSFGSSCTGLERMHGGPMEEAPAGEELTNPAVFAEADDALIEQAVSVAMAEPLNLGFAALLFAQDDAIASAESGSPCPPMETEADRITISLEGDSCTAESGISYGGTATAVDLPRAISARTI